MLPLVVDFEAILATKHLATTIAGKRQCTVGELMPPIIGPSAGIPMAD